MTRAPQRRRTTAALLGTGLALVLGLSGCGENSIEDYCAELSANRTALADMIDSESPAALLDNLPLLRGLADKAPEDLADEWRVFVGALDDLEKALDDAGVKAREFGDGTFPADVSASDRERIVAAANEIRSDDVVAAAAGIEQQGRDVCKVNLGL